MSVNIKIAKFKLRKHTMESHFAKLMLDKIIHYTVHYFVHSVHTASVHVRVAIDRQFEELPQCHRNKYYIIII